MEKRYQVFVSSTFRDLQAERSEVIQALLELDCIPSGMELFPAADEDQWSYIQRIIDDCDYYVVVLAGKYGSISPVTGKSYTQMEYEYALSKNIPTIAFLHKNLDLLTMERNERDPVKRELLEKFRGDVEQRLCKHWENADQLGAVVSRSMTQLIKSRPAVGWVRADRVPDESSAQEIARLRRRIEELEGQVKPSESVELSALGIDLNSLKQGDDVFQTVVSYQGYIIDSEDDGREISNTTLIKFTWNEIFIFIGQQLQKSCSTEAIRKIVDGMIFPRINSVATITNIDVNENDFYSHLYSTKIIKPY